MADVTLERVRKGMSECIDMHIRPWLETVRCWQNAIDVAIKQREQDAKDAARYRRLLKLLPSGTLGDWDVSDIQSWAAAIDAVMAKEPDND